MHSDVGLVHSNRTNAIPVVARFSISAYFGDVDDSHRGDENDPRVVVIEVVPNEVRYWLAKSGSISRGVQEVVQTVRGEVSIPGELRTITAEEVGWSMTV
jgi:hypothetical protein